VVAIEAFCAYSQVDEKLKRDLLAALSPLQRMDLLNVWNFRLIPIGRDWEAEISFHLHSAEIILLLVSSDFINSNYCYGIEMATALERHHAGKARVIPIILRDCLWEGLPFSRLQVLPTSSKPVKRWQDRDAAWTDVARGVQSSLFELRECSVSSILPRTVAKEDRVTLQGSPHNNFFDVAAAGDVVVAAEDEPRFALESVRLCERIMRTISYREEDWWRAEVGHEYLREQQSLLARNGTIERIFIVPGPNDQRSLGALTETMDSQSAAGINVFYIYELDIPAGYFSWVQDFILYDDKLLRVSTTVAADGLLGRPAEIHTNSGMVRRALQWYNGLKALSTPWATPTINS